MPKLHFTEKPQSLTPHWPATLKQQVAAGQSITDASYVLIRTAYWGPPQLPGHIPGPDHALGGQDFLSWWWYSSTHYSHHWRRYNVCKSFPGTDHPLHCSGHFLSELHLGVFGHLLCVGMSLCHNVSPWKFTVTYYWFIIILIILWYDNKFVIWKVIIVARP